MLEGLDDVDWGVLEHAYGTAADLPDTIRALASSDADVRDEARETLYGNIFHQGTRYEATAHAVPFLLELLADPATPDRPELVGLVTCLAVSYDEQWLPETFPVAQFREAAVGGEELLRAAPPPVDAWSDDDGGLHREDDRPDRYSYVESLSDEQADALYAHIEVTIYEVVRAGLPLLRSLAADRDPALRREAAYALAWFPEDAAGSLPVLLAAAVPGGDDVDALTAAATALVAAGMLGRAAGDGVDRETLVAAATAALTDERELLRWSAAVALGALRGADAGPDVVAELLTWAGGEAGARDDVPFLDGDVAGLAALALRHLDDAHTGVVYDTLLGRLPTVSGPEAVTVAAEALRRAWPERRRIAETTPFAALSAPQQRLLEVLAGSPATWSYLGLPFGNFGGLLSGYGLPPTVDEMRAYVAGSRQV